LLAAGHASEAEQLMRRCCDSPSRQGSNSADPLSDELANCVLLWTALQSQLVAHEETDFLVNSPLAEREAVRASIRAQCWRLRHEIMKILSDGRRPNPLRPYLPEETYLESWMMGQYVQLLPHGLVQELLRDARKSETHPAAVPYFDAFEAEAALVAGDPQTARELAAKALVTLPVQHEKLLRARTNAVAAEASRLLSDHADYLHRIDEVLTDFPGVLQFLQIAIPVRLEADGDPLAKELTEKLVSSPLLRADPDGLVLRIARSGSALTVSFANRSGGTRWTSTVAPPQAESLEEGGNPGDGDKVLVQQSLQQMRARLFCPWLELSPVQINGFSMVPR
jgi:hypothetical protein